MTKVYTYQYIYHCIHTLCGVLADCGMPDIPTNGMVSFNSTVEGSMANYTCDEGYILDGVFQQTCEENGQWSGDPQCQCKLIDITRP